MLGAQISYCAQKIDYSGINLKSSEVSSKLKERISLSVMYLIGNNFSQGLENLSLDRIVEITNMPYEFVYSSIKDLSEKNLLVESADTPTTYLPAKELELISLEEIVNASRTNEQSEIFIIETDSNLGRVDHVLAEIDSSIYRSLAGMTLKDLVTKD